jgi:hypothetical protein
MSLIFTPPVLRASDIPDSTSIWRYMDLPKFVSMLATGSLRLTKAATFRDDPYEGFCNAMHLAMPPSPEDGCKVIAREDVQGKTMISLAQMLADFSRGSAEACRKAREHLYVNSWCLASESMAMWEIYGSHGFGLALKSSVGQYRQAARFNLPLEHYDFGAVMYHDDIASAPEIVRDFRNGAIPVPGPALWRQMIDLAFHKRGCYEYEKEWRAALYQDLRPEISGIDIEFDLKQLISAVYVGPRAEEFFYDAVASVMDKFQLQKPLERSALLRVPEEKEAATDSH